MKIHYSRAGYDGNYTYTSVCGKKVKTHQEIEKSSIHVEQANCKECLDTKEYQTDLKDYKNTDINIKRKIYIESDILQADEFRSAQEVAKEFTKNQSQTCVDRVFSDVLDYAWHDLDKTWEAVKKADEIWATSSLMPLSGGTYMGAPVIFNKMCEKAVEEGITGKSVIILNNLKYIEWYMIEIDIMKKAFESNKLFMYNDNYELEEVKVKEIKFK